MWNDVLRSVVINVVRSGVLPQVLFLLVCGRVEEDARV